MERRRIIGYILLALAAVICLASNVWFIVKMPMGGEKVSHLIFRTLTEVIALLAVVYTFVRSGKTVNLKLDIRERRLKLDESHAIDPYGYSYIMLGAMSVCIILIFAVDIMDKLGVPLFDRISAGWCIVVLSVLTVALVLWLSVKIEMAKRRDNNS
ncbi:MAG: hypothetical protein IJK84_02305 [Bacteroidales bacterium]|nr:hypothetical protein [Bacteroidales bacterium]